MVNSLLIIIVKVNHLKLSNWELKQVHALQYLLVLLDLINCLIKYNFYLLEPNFRFRKT